MAKDGALVGGFSIINPDGINRWTAPNGGTLYSGPALDAKGRIYIGSQNASYVATLYAFEADGQPRWQFVADGTILSEPAVGDDGTTYFRSDSGKVFAVDAAGQKRWDFDTAAPQLGSTPPSVAQSTNGTVYVAAFDGILHALSPTGEPKWNFSSGSGMAVAPLIAPDGTLYFGTGTGTFYAIEGDGSGLAQAPWPMHRRDQRFSASYADTPTPPATPQNISASINEFTDRVNVTWQSAPGATSYEVWRSAAEDGGDATLLGPVFGKIQFQDRSSVEGQTNFYLVRSVNSAGSSALGGPAQGVRRIANEGELVWQFSISGALGTPAIAADGTSYSTGSDGKLYAIQPNGVKKWEFDYSRSAATAPSVGVDGTIFFAASTRSNAVTAPKEGWSFLAVTPTGEKKWQLDRKAVAAPAFAIGADGSFFAATVERNRLLARCEPRWFNKMAVHARG